MILAVTGSRSLHTSGDSIAIQRAIQEQFYNLKPTNVLIGGAQGFDYLVAKACKDVSLNYTLCIPNKGYGEYYWNGKGAIVKDIRSFNVMCNDAYAMVYVDEVMGIKGLYHNGKHINMIRNEYMIDRCETVIAMKKDWLQKSAGTDHAINYALNIGIPVREVYIW